MYRIRAGSVFDEHRYQTITCPVNCQGVMGAGLALAFKKKYPALYLRYRADCTRGAIRPGRIPRYTVNGQSIICFPTKDLWMDPAQLEWIQMGLDSLLRADTKLGITSLTLAPLGCGLGQLSINDVHPLIDHAAFDLPYDVELVIPEKDIHTLAERYRHSVVYKGGQ